MIDAEQFNRMHAERNMINIVERLRDISEYSFPDDLCREAATEIENLQAKLRISENALEEQQSRDDFLMKVLGMSPDDVKELLQMLEEKRKET